MTDFANISRVAKNYVPILGGEVRIWRGQIWEIMDTREKCLYRVRRGISDENSWKNIGVIRGHLEICTIGDCLDTRVTYG